MAAARGREFLLTLLSELSLLVLQEFSCQIRLFIHGGAVTLCWPMGYNTYKPQQAQELRNRIHDAVHHLQSCRCYHLSSRTICCTSPWEE
ncbi:hypothetical protein C8R48DRAFT_707501 [Suillus tomentosus]|nr:hypothetical protein C8R48DRAFT_707501 [Suillus tomentosus]